MRDAWYPIGVWAFTAGCLLFTLDAVTARPVRLKYLGGCLLFDLGCVGFLGDFYDKA